MDEENEADGGLKNLPTVGIAGFEPRLSGTIIHALSVQMERRILSHMGHISRTRKGHIGGPPSWEESVEVNFVGQLD